MALPDIVYIVIDDARADVMRDGLPRTTAFMAAQGTTFPNFYTTSPLCGPSRASTLRGQYSHNTGVYSNTPPEAGAGHAALAPLEGATMATVLDAAGYGTHLLGKYMNGFPAAGRPYKPPGWDRVLMTMRGAENDAGERDPHNHYVLWNGSNYIEVGNGRAPRSRNEKPSRRTVPAYEADRLAYYANATIRANPREPLFLYVAPVAVHYPYNPPDRYRNAVVPLAARPPSYDEADVTDKSAWTRNRMGPMSAATHRAMNQQQRRQRQMMLAVDDLVMTTITALRETGRLSNAFVVVTSDNGYMAGEHRLAGGKSVPYDEATRMPLYIAGPGVAKGAVRQDMIANIDLLPTFAAMAGRQPPEFVDGRSFLGAAQGGPALTRHHIGLELLTTSWPGLGLFQGFATATGTYATMTQTGEHEAYDRSRDPFQFVNIWPALQPPLRDAILARNAALAGCAAQSCRDAEDEPPTPIRE